MQLSLPKTVFLCSGVTDKANEVELTKAYKVFNEQAKDIDTNYQAKTVNTDSWHATGNALKMYLAILLLLFHAFYMPY